MEFDADETQDSARSDTFNAMSVCMKTGISGEEGKSRAVAIDLPAGGQRRF